VKVRLLEVSLYARGPRKGDVCRDVAFHEEMSKIPSRYTWNNRALDHMDVTELFTNIRKPWDGIEAAALKPPRPISQEATNSNVSC